MRKLISTSALVAGFIALAVVIVALGLHYYPSTWSTAVRMTSRVPFAVIPAVGAVLVFAVLRRWNWLGIAVLAALALVWSQLPLWIGESPPAGERFTVITANLRLGEADTEALAELVDSSHADLLSLQEVTPEALARIRAGRIVARLPHVYAIPVSQTGGTALLSAQPLVGAAPVPGTADRMLSAVTDLPGAPGTRVLAIHPRAPLGGFVTSWDSDLRALGDYLRSTPQQRVVAAGDFNATWDSSRYRALLTDGFADAAEQIGAGFLPTFPANRSRRPFITLDHVITRGFAAASLSTHDIPGSDHRAVVVTLVAS